MPFYIGKSKELKELRPIIEGFVREYDTRITFHDLRIVKGPTHTNVIFDIVVPIDCKEPDKIVRGLKREVKNVNKKYNCVINVDRDYSNGKDGTNNFGD